MSEDFIAFTLARRESRGELTAAWLDGGRIVLYDAPRPATADTAITTQTALVGFDLASPAGVVTDDVFAATLPDPAICDHSGTAAWARAYDASAAPIADLDVGLSGSGAALLLDNLSLVEGGQVTLTGFLIAES
jgi:hypothetical protein